jgi:predicted GIY-YIG superfamily endonuclease
MTNIVAAVVAYAVEQPTPRRHPEEPDEVGRLEGRTPLAAWTYMLRSRDGSYYVGCTTNLDQRIGEHQAGLQKSYTSARLPVELVWVEEFQHLDDAITNERQIKGWSRAKKEALIARDWFRVQALSVRASRRPTASGSSA